MGFLGTTTGSQEPFVVSAARPLRQHRRLMSSLAMAVAVSLVSVVTVVLPAGAQPGPAVVANPGRVLITVTSGAIGLGGVDLPLPPCDEVGTGCLSFTATVAPDGSFTVANRDLQLPRFDLPLDQLGQAIPIGLSVETYTAGAIGGLISPQGRLARLELGLGVRLVPDLSSLGPLSFLASGASCGIGPVQLSLTTGGSGDVTGVPYDPDTGTASLVDGRYEVPGLACSPLISIILPLLAGDALAGVNINDVIGTANQALGLPSSSGDSAVTFDVTVSRVGSDALMPLTSGGIAWPSTGFGDVPGSAIFDEAVRWLKAQGITTGLGGSATVFGPGAAVNRGQMAAFVWRMMDRRNAPADCGFTDVRSSAFFARAVCWLKAANVTTGVNGTSAFAPDRALTRGEMALFLWRVAGEPAGSPPSAFTDLAPGAGYVPAVAWLSANGITTGMRNDPSTFNPGGAVTRAQMALFLYRLVSTPQAWDPAVTLPTAIVPPLPV